MTANLYDWFWVSWLVYFLVIEFSGIRKKITGSTLTEHVRRVYCFSKDTANYPLRWPRRIIFCLFWGVLSGHFILLWNAWPSLDIVSVPFGLTYFISTFFEKHGPVQRG